MESGPAVAPCHPGYAAEKKRELQQVFVEGSCSAIAAATGVGLRQRMAPLDSQTLSPKQSFDGQLGACR